MTAMDIPNTKYKLIYEPAAAATNHINPSSGEGKDSLRPRERRNRRKYILIVNDDKHYPMLTSLMI